MKNLEKLITLLAAICFVVILVLALLQVFCRTVLGVGVPWTEEINRLFFVYLVYLGAAVSVMKAEMIAVDTVLQALKGAVRITVEKIILIFNILFSALMLFSGILMLRTVWPTTFATVPWLSNGFLYIPLIISFAIMLATFVRQLLTKEG